MIVTVWHKGKEIKIKYENYIDNNWHQLVWVDEKLLGHVFHTHAKTWSVVSQKKLSPVSPCNGFQSRRYATEYLLSLNGY